MTLLNKLKERAIIGAIACAVIIPTYLTAHSYFALETVRTKITDAQMVKVDKRYMIATEQEPFENHDAYYRWKFNSGTIQNQAIKLKGKEVELEVYGWRNPLFSMYRNIRTIKPISEQQ